jgi:hypothetical protein
MPWPTTTDVMAVASCERVITVAVCLMAVALAVAVAVSLATPDTPRR